MANNKQHVNINSVLNNEDKNYKFYRLFHQKSNSVNTTEHLKVKQKIYHLKIKLEQMEEYQREQWSYIIQNKCVQLKKSHKIESLKLNLEMLVILCNRLKIIYNADQVEDLIKEIYYEIHADKILEIFALCGYNTDNYNCLVYKQSLMTRIWNWFG